MLTKQQEQWVRDSLANDETATDEELIEWFVEEYGLSQEDAKACVSTKDLKALAEVIGKGFK